MEATLRVLVAFGFTLLLVMLRLESERFGTAEYDEPIDGRRVPLARRLTYWGIGLVGIVAILFAHPGAGRDLFLRAGNPSGAILLGLVLAVGGAAQAWVLAWSRYRHLRLPDVTAYPGAIANEVLTAFLDEATFRGALLGFLVLAGVGANVAVVIQALVYALATRLGAPGRDRYMLLLALVVGVVAGWATIVTGGIGAAFLGHAVTRVAVFLTTGHSGHPAPPGGEDEDIARRRGMPEGWRAVVGQGIVRER